MKKITTVLLVLLFSIPTIAVADVIQYADGAYSTPSGWTEIALKNVTSLDHYYYYKWTIGDIAYVPSAVNIVFHHIRDWAVESDQIAVYLKNSITGPTGWTSNSDNQSLSLPDWSTSWSNLGLWSDPAGGTTYYDVVFTIPLLADRTILANSNFFKIGIDPDCHYDLTNITIDVATPVPEPATMLLLGSGLLGLWGFRRKLKS